MTQYWPKAETNPIKINPDGSQSPNPNYQGPNPYKKGPDGKLSRIKPPTPKGSTGFLGQLGQLGMALSTGATIGNWMVDNLNQNVSVSGRGAGRKAFTDTNKPTSTRSMSEQGHGEIYYQPGVGYFNRTTGAMVPGGRNLPKTTKADETAAGIIAESHRPGAGFSTGGVNSAADLEQTGPRRTEPAPDGSEAKGTQTGFQGYNIDLGIAEALLGRVNAKSSNKIADVNNFMSNDLPTVDISGPEFDATQRPDGTYNAPEKVVVGGKAVNFADLDGALSDTVVEGISTPGKTGISSADTADNNRSVSIPGDERTNWMEPRQKSYSELRREAFLDPNNRGYGAIRAADAAVGRFRQGDKFFVNDGGNLREINEDAWRTGQHRALSASEMKDAYVDSVKETLVPVATADAFDVGDTPITEAKQTTADYMGDIAETEFNMNNVAPGVSDRARMKGDYFNTGDDNDED